MKIRARRAVLKACATAAAIATIFVASMAALNTQRGDATGTSDRQGRIACRHPSHDFGEVEQKQAKKLRHSFVIANTSPHAVRIEGLTMSCGCTDADYSSGLIAPGGASPIKVSMDWSSSIGPRDEHILVKFDRAGVAPLMLRLTGNIVTDLSVTPDQLDFGSVQPGQRLTEIVAVRSLDEEVGRPTFEIKDRHLSVRPLGEGHNHEHSPETMLVTRFAVTLEVPEDFGRWRSEIEFTAGESKSTALRRVLPISAFIRGGMEANPRALIFTALPDKLDPSDQKVYVRLPQNGADPTARLHSDESPHPFVIQHEVTISDDVRTLSISVGIDYSLTRQKKLWRAEIGVVCGANRTTIPLLLVMK